MIRPPDHQKMIKFVISLAFFMEAMDSTIINTALPAIANSLLVTPIALKIAVISYLLSLAIFIPISGWLADKFGSKKIYIIAMLIFTISSACCGLAQNIEQLVLARLCQGVGGALGLPIGRLIILRSFNREQYISVMNQMITMGALGIMLGPIVGGLITHYFTWQWIFWINIPIGIFTTALAYYYFHNTSPVSPPALDIFGFICFGFGLSGLTFGLSSLSNTMIEGYISGVVLCISLLFLLLYRIHSKKVAHPIIKFDLLSQRTFRVSVLGNVLVRLGFGGIPFLLPLLFQINLHFSPQRSGLLFAPMAIGILISKQCTLYLLQLLHYRKLLLLNTCLASGSIALFGLIDEHSSVIMIASLTATYGFLMSLQYSTMNSIAYADICEEHLSAAGSLVSTLQQISQSIGVAIAGFCVHILSFIYATDNQLPLAIFHGTFYILSFITLLSLMVFSNLSSEDGYQMILKHDEETT